MTITMVKVRATISVGSITAKTPSSKSQGDHILSFNVDKARGKPSSFSASLKVDGNKVTGSTSGSRISITAGTDTVEFQIFTGIVKAANITPCKEDPGFVILNLSGEDILSKLQGKKFTRRCRSSRGVWVGIEGIVRPGLRSTSFQFTPGGAWLDSVGSDIKQIDQPNKTNNIANPREQSERAPNNEAGGSEVSIDIVLVDPQTT
jgi:hypothetical protein